MSTGKPNANRHRAATLLAALLAAAGPACGGTNPLLDLPEEERYFLLQWAGGSIEPKHGTGGAIRSMHNVGESVTFTQRDYLRWGGCRPYHHPNYVTDGNWTERNCREYHPRVTLENLRMLGYRVELRDVARYENYEFMEEQTYLNDYLSEEEKKVRQRRYEKFQRRLGLLE